MYNTGLYVYLNPGSGSGLLTADNGLTATGTNVQLGGALLGNTEVDLTAGKFIFTLGPNALFEFEQGGTLGIYDPLTANRVFYFNEPIANEWELTLGNNINQSGAIRLYNTFTGHPNPFRITDFSGLVYFRIGSNGYSYTNGMFAYSGAVQWYAGSVNSPGVRYGVLDSRGVVIENNANIPFSPTPNAIRLTSVDLSAGNTMLRLDTEGTGALAAGAVTQTHTIAISYNGTTYYLLAASTR